MKNRGYMLKTFLLGSFLTISVWNLNAQVDTHKAVIDTGANILTVVNVIQPKGVGQDVILAYLQKGLNETMRYQPGFISANIHKSLDNDNIIVYAQWKDQESLQNAVKLIENGGAPNMSYVFGNSIPDYHPYEVISVNLTSDSK